MLGYVEFAINSAVAEGTGQVPAELTIGELPRTPLDTVVQAGGHAGARDFVQHVQDLLGRARAHLEKAREYQKRYFDRHHRHQEHAVGDWVLLSTRNLHLAAVRKLRQRFVGPFKVLQRVGQTAYKLDLQGRFVGVHNVFHVSQLKPHVAGGSSAAPPEPVEVEGEPQYEVERLVRHREQRGGTRYLVRWTGYGPEHDEWVHEEELGHARRLLEDYKAANGLS